MLRLLKLKIKRKFRGQLDTKTRYFLERNKYKIYSRLDKHYASYKETDWHLNGTENKTKQNKNKMINPDFYTIKNVFQNKEEKKRHVVSDRHPRLTQRIRDLEK